MIAMILSQCSPAISSRVFCYQKWNNPLPGLPPKAISAKAGWLDWSGLSKEALAEVKSQAEAQPELAPELMSPLEGTFWSSLLSNLIQI